MLCLGAWGERVSFQLGFQILVVDDNAHMRALVVAILRGAGFVRVSEASNGAEALSYIKLTTPDIIITDLHMPIMDGIQLTQIIRANPYHLCAHIPIIMITGQPEFSKITAARDAGINEIIRKPISSKVLLERLAAVIDRPRPFVRSSLYTGPCRRRSYAPVYEGPLRRKLDQDDNVLICD